MFRARGLGMSPVPAGWPMLLRIVDWVDAHWREPDEGIWEVRGPRRNFVHSKVMAWVAVDRMARAIEDLGLDGPLERFKQMRAEIHAEVCREGYDATRNTFTQYHGSTPPLTFLKAIADLQIAFRPGLHRLVARPTGAPADTLPRVTWSRQIEIDPRVRGVKLQFNEVDFR